MDAEDVVTGMTVEVHHHFDADPSQVWDLLSDVEGMAGLGPEHACARWTGTERGVGAVFEGTNRRGDFEWKVPCHIVEWDRPRSLGWTVLAPSCPSSTWTYTLAPAPGGGTDVVQRFVHGPGPSFVRRQAEADPSSASAVVGGRARMLEADMTTVLEAAERLLVAK